MSILYENFKQGLLVTGNGDFIQDEQGNYILVGGRGDRVIKNDVRYRVFLTILEKQNVYATKQLEITDYVELGGIKEIAIKLDNGDFDVGVFSFGLIELSLINHKGYFSHENEVYSLFGYSRDKAKITIEFSDKSGNFSAEFRGFVQEDHTVENPEEQTVKLSVLSRDAIFRKVFIRGGLIPSGATIKQALEIVLNRPDVTSVLNYKAANINPGLNIAIDDASSYDNRAAIDILDSLMLASGSVLIVDGDDNIIVRNRDHYTQRQAIYAAMYVTSNGNNYSLELNDGYVLGIVANNDVLNLPYYFYGAGDLLARHNILELRNLRNGQNRAFNQFTIGDTSSFDSNLIARYGFKEKRLTIDNVIVNADRRKIITDYYLNEFRYPRRECEIVVDTQEALNIRLLDVCCLFYDKLFKAREGAPPKKGLLTTEEGEYIVTEDGNYIEINVAGDKGTLPFYKRAVYGEARYPRELSKTTVDPRIGWKVIEKRQNISNMTTTLKLREIGSAPGQEIYGN